MTRDIRQFMPTLYFLLVLGITGFAVASESPGMWVLAISAVVLNAWLIRSGRFAPIPRWLATMFTLASLALVLAMIYQDSDDIMMMIGRYLVLLHLVKLYEQRANRDYAQLLLLSLLLMVAAAILTASLIFGFIFFLYLFVSLYCSLLFHLKIESDRARQKYGQPPPPAGLVSRNEERKLARSMRRLTGVIAVCGIIMAVAVFILFPRDNGVPLLNPVGFRNQPMAGFSDVVDLQNLGIITQNQDVIARVEVYKEGAQVTDPGDLWLRGATLDLYTGSPSFQWKPSDSALLDGLTIPLNSDSTAILSDADDNGTSSSNSTQSSIYRQVIELQPTGTNVLFAMAGVTQIQAQKLHEIRWLPHEGTMSDIDKITVPIRYEVNCTGEIPADDQTTSRFALRSDHSQIDPQILAYVRNPVVSGSDSTGRSLAEMALAGDRSHDAEIADNIERHLRSTFTYTLDLSNLGAVGARDPIVVFLYEFKSGYCEYFAGAMTLMCQSLGIPARMVIGFHCDADDFNTVGNYYVVRQSNAHAWCEAYSGKSWQRYDPTSGRDPNAGQRHTIWARVQGVFDYMEFKWADWVVAYDGSNRKNFAENINYQISKTAVAMSGHQMSHMTLQSLINKLTDTLFISVLSVVIEVMLLGIAAAIAWYFLERLALRRRARRMGLADLSTEDQLRLVRQLGFYDELLRVLERHQIARPANQTPLEFGRSLSFLPWKIYDDILRLTDLFYRVRYGTATLEPARQKHLVSAVRQIQQTLDKGESA